MPSSMTNYTITADCRWGPRKATRASASSAMCLADDWAEEGCYSVHVTDGAGTVLDRDAFRATLPIVRRMAERRR